VTGKDTALRERLVHARPDVSRGRFRPVRNYFVSWIVVVLLAMPVAGQPGQEAVPTPGIPPTGFAGLDQYRATRIAMFTDDYGQLGRYREANAALRAFPPGHCNKCNTAQHKARAR